jgi:hypothetical protein
MKQESRDHMPRKLHTIRALSLLPFLAILFIGVGMPVIHPALHDHAGIHSLHSPHSPWEHEPGTDTPLLSAAVTGEYPECPICAFLAANHLQHIDERPIFFLPILISSLLHEQFQVSGQACRLLPESRGPPQYTS